MVLTEEQRMIQESVGQLAARELAPQAARVDKDRIFPREGLRQLAADGLFGMAVPESLGGSGSDAVSFALATEAVAKVCASTALLFTGQRQVARMVALCGTDKQKQRLLPALLNGEKLGGVAVTEACSGVDASAMAMHAKSDGDDLVINGSKIMVAGAGEADVYVTLLRTDRSEAPMDLTAVLVEKDTPGFSFGSKAEARRAVSDR